MAERRRRTPSSKRLRRSADEIARTPEYRALLAEISALIRAAKARGAVRPRVTMRDLRQGAKAQDREVENAE